jgi:hypothetical protein
MSVTKYGISLAGRIETGPVQFNDDWPGVFIRGDNAAFMALALSTVIDAIDQDEIQVGDQIAIVAVKQLKQLLESCKVEFN